MTSKQQRWFSRFEVSTSGVLALIILLLTAVMTAPSAQAQALSTYAFSTVYDFTGGNDGGFPAAGLIRDSAGNLYGTNSSNTSGWGNVFEVSPGGAETVLYSFCAAGFPCPDGGEPESSLILDSAGNLYGTAVFGGTNRAGLVFELSPAPSGGVCPSGTKQGTGWCETILYSFTGGSDGTGPVSKLIMDSAGNLYGTTEGSKLDGGIGTAASECGSVFELSSPSAGDIWSEHTLYDFAGGKADGCGPLAGVVMDSIGDLYGTTSGDGANGVGAVYELTPGADSAWTETVLYSFGAQNVGGTLLDGANPASDLIFIGSSLYGTTTLGGKGVTSGDNGTVFELTPPSSGEITWTETVIYPFNGGTDGCQPQAGVTEDPYGNLYGTAFACGKSGQSGNWGAVYELSPPASGTTWNATSLYDFLGDGDKDVDGGNPTGLVLVDSKGNLYGTSSCGNCNFLAGSVWELLSPALPTTTTITSTSNPSTYGESVTFTATITSSSGQVKRRVANRKNRNLQAKAQGVTGSVSWSGNTSCGTTPVTSGNPATATCTTSSLNAGSDTVTATYSGDAANNTSQGTLSQTVVPAAQQITVTAPAPLSAIDGSNFTVAATSTSGSPVQISTSGACSNTGTGTGSAIVTITSGNTKLICEVIFSAAASNNYESATLTEQITIIKPTKPTVSFTGAPATAVYGSTFTVVATTNASTTAIITTAGSCSANGTTITMTSGTGSCTLKAMWAADDVYSAATATQKTMAAKLAGQIAWATPAAVTYGTALSATQLNATANVPGKLTYTPAAGKVLTAGTQTLSVKLAPTQTSDYTDATSTVQVVVDPTSSTTAITKTAPASPTAGSAVTVYFSVAAAYGHPTGSVTVSSSNGGPTCTGTLTLGKGTCSLTFPSSGFYTLTALYSGDNNDTSSTSAGFLLAVN